MKTNNQIEIGKIYQYNPWYHHKKFGDGKRIQEDTICRVCNKIYNLGYIYNFKFKICPICSWKFFYWILNQELLDKPRITKTRWTKTNVELFLKEVA